MKVVIFGYYFIEHIIELANNLIKTDDVTIIIPKKYLPYFRKEIAKGIQVYIFPGVRSYSIINFRVIFLINSIIKRFKPDIIHIEHTATIWTSLVGFIRKKARVIFTIHDPRLHEGEPLLKKVQALFSLFLATKFNMISGFIVHGRELRKNFIVDYKVKSNLVYYVPLGPYNSRILEKYSIGKVEEKDGNILFFGRLRKYKGLPYLIDACEKLKNEGNNLTLTICGESDLDNFRPYLKQIKGKDYIEIVRLGMMMTPESYRKASFYFKRSKFIVLPYISATGSAIVSNAYIFKKPVVASSTGGIPDVVFNNVTGLLVPPRNTDLLAESIADLLKNEEKRIKLGKNGYKYLRSQFSSETVAKLHRKIYLDAIGKD